MRDWKSMLILAVVCVATALTALTALGAGRVSKKLDTGWRFKEGDVAGPEKANFSDGDWEAISIPHNWGIEQAQQGDMYRRAPGWYRKTLDIKRQSGRRYFVKFEAAGSVADVYVNGTSVGQHRGAFGAFCFEITGQLNTNNAPNVLAVRVSNAVEPDVAPLSGDFCVFGGLYRMAHLIETDELCITPTDHGSPGVAWLETSVTKKQALLDVNTQISNPSARKRLVTLIARVVDAGGKEVAVVKRDISLEPRQTEPFTLRVPVKSPHLWNGRADPYLYKAVVELESNSGFRDSVEQPLGLRSFRVDPDKGFFLNGELYHLHGVNRHQDRPDKGWALTEADQDEDMAMIKEIGATVVRCAHYQHSDYFYSLCDKAGILVWAEIPQVDEVGTVPEFAETSRSQLQDLIRQNINHPAIFTWSIFNELRIGKPDPHRLLSDLTIVAHGEDPTRPVIAATCVTDLPQMNKIPDLLGWNIYPGWYTDWGPLASYGEKLDGYRDTSKSGGYCVSEYGAGANVAQHEQNAKQPRANGQWHPEEWQALVHEQAWGALKTRPYIWGTFVWNMFDFTSYYRNEGGIKGRNDKGLVTYDRSVKKDAFYFYKANWSDEPVLYITSRRFTERTNGVTDVKVYSNAASVQLLVNEKSQGELAKNGDGIFIWKDVKLAPGQNQIEARARRMRKDLSDNCTWTLKAQ